MTGVPTAIQERGVVDFIRRGTDRLVWPRPGGRPQLRLLDLLQQDREGAVDDRARIAVGDLAAKKRLQPPQLLVGLRADGELRDSAGAPRPGRSGEAWPAELKAMGRSERLPQSQCPPLRARWSSPAGPESIASLPARAPCPPGGGVALGQGSFRTALGRSGRGASSATRASISCRLPFLAFATTVWWFSAVRCRPSRRTEVRVREPEARSSRIRGKRWQARAAAMRLHAASSASRRAWVQ